MNWGGWSDFWAMGGYAGFVWGSYGVTLLVLALEVYVLRRRRARALAAVRRTEQQMARDPDESTA